MTIKQARETVKPFLDNYLQTVHGIDPRGTFRCLNPGHRDSDPSMSVSRHDPSGIACQCFGCGARYDIFDLIALDNGVSNAEAFKIGCSMYNITVDGYEHTHTTGTPKRRAAPTELETIGRARPALSFRLSDALKAAHRAAMNDPGALDHYTRRGLSREIIERYQLGYSAAGHNALLQAYPENQSKSRKQGLYKYIFPYTNAAGKLDYFISEISDRGQIDDWNKKYSKIKMTAENSENSGAPLFNERYLTAENPPPVVFICEGIFDALSVEEAGQAAIACMGTADRRLKQLIAEHKPRTVLVLALDADGAGSMANERVAKFLDLLHFPYIVRTAEPLGAKDFNEALTTNRAAFLEYIRATAKETENMIEHTAPPEPSEIADATPIQERAAADVPKIPSNAEKYSEYRRELETNAESDPAYIGFNSLQAIIRTALIKGLICIGAAPSAGKTTFVMQIAGAIASKQRHVLVFSLEMSRAELIARDVSRLSYELPRQSPAKFGDIEPRTVAEILSGCTYDHGQCVRLSERQRERLDRVESYYNSGMGQYIHVMENDTRLTAADMTTIARRFVIDHPGEQPPVIIVDYLQLIRAADRYSDERRATDDNVWALKTMCRELHTPVFAITATARANYYETDPEGFGKESGGIEYTADCTMFMQTAAAFENYSDEGRTADERAKQRTNRIKQSLDGDTRKIIVSIIKNRAGRRNQYIAYDYSPAYNCFIESGIYMRTYNEYGKKPKEEQQTSTGKKKKRTQTTTPGYDDIDF